MIKVWKTKKRGKKQQGTLHNGGQLRCQKMVLGVHIVNLLPCECMFNKHVKDITTWHEYRYI